MQSEKNPIGSFLKNYIKKNGRKNTHNIYHIQKIDKAGNVVQNSFATNLVTNHGMNDMKGYDSGTSTGCLFILEHLYIGTGNTQPSVTDTNLTNIAYNYPASTESGSQPANMNGSYPIEYDSETGYIIETIKETKYSFYFDYELTGITEDIVIREIGFADDNSRNSYTQNTLYTHSLIYDEDGEVTSITKKDTEKLIISIYITSVIHEDEILNGLSHVDEDDNPDPIYMLIAPSVIDPSMRYNFYSEQLTINNMIAGSQLLYCYVNNSYYWNIEDFNKTFENDINDYTIDNRIRYIPYSVYCNCEYQLVFSYSSDDDGSVLSFSDRSSHVVVTNPHKSVCFDVSSFAHRYSSSYSAQNTQKYEFNTYFGLLDKGMTSIMFRMPELPVSESVSLYGFVDVFYDENPSFRRQINIPFASGKTAPCWWYINESSTSSSNVSIDNPLFRNLVNTTIYSHIEPGSLLPCATYTNTAFNLTFGYGCMNSVSNIDVSHVYMYNKSTDEFDIPISFESDTYDYRESFNIHAALPLSVNDNIGNTDKMAGTFVNTDLTTPITSFTVVNGTANFKLYAADKYWDESTYTEITDLSNVPVALRTKRYYIGNTYKYVIVPHRAGLDSHHYTTPTNQAYQVDISETESATTHSYVTPAKYGDSSWYSANNNMEYIPHSIKKNWAVVNNSIVYFDETHGQDDVIKSLPDDFDSSLRTPLAVENPATTSPTHYVKFLNKRNSRFVSDGGTMMIQEYGKLENGKTWIDYTTKVYTTFALFDMVDFPSGSTTCNVYDVELLNRTWTGSDFYRSGHREGFTNNYIVGSYYDTTDEIDYIFIGYADSDTNKITYKVISKIEGSAPVIGEETVIENVDVSGLKPSFAHNSPNLLYMTTSNARQIEALNVVTGDSTGYVEIPEGYTIQSTVTIGWKNKFLLDAIDASNTASLLICDVLNNSVLPTMTFRTPNNSYQLKLLQYNVYNNPKICMSTTENYMMFFGGYHYSSSYDYIFPVLWDMNNDSIHVLPFSSRISNMSSNTDLWTDSSLAHIELFESSDGKHLLAIFNNGASTILPGSLVLDIGYFLNRGELYPKAYYNYKNFYTPSNDYNWSEGINFLPVNRCPMSVIVPANDGLFSVERPGNNGEDLKCYWSPYENHLMLNVTGTTTSVTAVNNPKKITVHCPTYKAKNNLT